MMWTRRASSTIEYILLVILVLGSLFVFKDYIARAFNGKWKNTGDSFGMGRQYDPKKTTDCAYALNDDGVTGFWYDDRCYTQAVTNCVPSNQICEKNQKTGCKTAYCQGT